MQTQYPISTVKETVVHHAQVVDATEFLVKQCYGLANNAGWWVDAETGEDVRTWPKKFMDLWIAAKLMLCVTELAEAMEGLRKNLPDDKLPHFPMLGVELADNLIRLCDLAGGLCLPLGEMVAQKLAFNAQRPDHKLENRLAAGGKSI